MVWSTVSQRFHSQRLSYGMYIWFLLEDSPCSLSSLLEGKGLQEPFLPEVDSLVKEEVPKDLMTEPTNKSKSILPLLGDRILSFNSSTMKEDDMLSWRPLVSSLLRREPVLSGLRLQTIMDPLRQETVQYRSSLLLRFRHHSVSLLSSIMEAALPFETAMEDTWLLQDELLFWGHDRIMSLEMSCSILKLLPFKLLFEPTSTTGSSASNKE